MNAVEIEEAISELFGKPIEREAFPFEFLAAFGCNETTRTKLKASLAKDANPANAVLWRLHVHLAVAEPGQTGEMLALLKASPRMAKARAKFVLATDGETVEAEELATGEALACPWAELPKHFGYFLPLAGISTVAEIKDNPVDIKATGRLNKLYLELLRANEDWSTDAKRPALNQFMARLIFCFFAEDTGIFLPGLFTNTLRQMTDPQSTNTHEVIGELFRVMDTKPTDRDHTKLRPWAISFPYVNGGLFTDSIEVPRFSKMARSYLLRAGELDWKEINPDIFGSMIQAVADDDERGSLGMHYTSVPNILKVLDPLFLDDLREELAKAGDNARKLLNLRKRIAAIRVFDPACGSGNFLVIAYIKMREIEAEIIRRRGEADDKTARRSWIKLTNFYGIEIKSFPAEIARLALLIAEFQCNVRHIDQIAACMEVLPLHATGKIVTGNALRLDWLEVCPPPKPASLVEEDLAGPTGRLALDSLAEPEGETYICGNPPYLGSKWQSDSQKADLAVIFEDRLDGWRSLDYVAGWFLMAADYGACTPTSSAFVATNSVVQGQHVPILWPEILQTGRAIIFAHTSFKWTNLASHKAGVTVVIVGLGHRTVVLKRLFYDSGEQRTGVKEVKNINPYLIAGPDVIVHPSTHNVSGLPEMVRGNSPTDGGHLILERDEIEALGLDVETRKKIVKKFVGSRELIAGTQRNCIWIEDNFIDKAVRHPSIASRIGRVRQFRLLSKKTATVRAAAWPHRFDERKPIPTSRVICVPVISSESRPYLPADVLPAGTVVSNKAFTMDGNELWSFAVASSRLNLNWVSAVCARMRTDFSYTNTLGWNTFPVPPLSDADKAALTRCAEDILLAREAYFPATIADMYDPDDMDEKYPLVRAAHEKNDETLERIYIGRRFRNDTERLEKLFDMYTKMTKDDAGKPAKSGKPKSKVKPGEAKA